MPPFSNNFFYLSFDVDAARAGVGEDDGQADFAGLLSEVGLGASVLVGAETRRLIFTLRSEPLGVQKF